MSSRAPHGLENESVTSYLNAILQLVFYTPEFRRMIYSYKPDKHNGLAYELQKLFTRLQIEDEKNQIETKELTQSFGWGVTERNQRHDLLEFFLLLLESLNPVVDLSSVYQIKGVDFIECSSCKGVKTKEENFYEISLTLRTQKKLILEKVLETKLQPENIGPYRCSLCSQRTDCLKGLKYSELPVNLLLTVQRTVWDFNTMQTSFIQHDVTIPQFLGIKNILEEEKILSKKKELGPTSQEARTQLTQLKLFAIEIEEMILNYLALSLDYELQYIITSTTDYTYGIYVKKPGTAKDWWYIQDAQVRKLEHDEIVYLLGDSFEVGRVEAMKSIDPRKFGVVLGYRQLSADMGDVADSELPPT